MGSESHMIRELKEVPGILSSKENTCTDVLCEIAHKFQGKIPVICGMGSSYFLAEFGVYFLKHIAGVPNAYSSEADELMSQVPNLGSIHVVLGLSQSGNSKETVDAIELSKKRGVFTCAMHNNTDSVCQQIAHLPIFQNIGTEKSPVSTKYIAFQLVLLYKIAVFLGEIEGKIDEHTAKEFVDQVGNLSTAISQVLGECEAKIKNLAESFKGNKFVIVGNGINTYSAQEIALKIRETTGLDATCDTEGLLKHGGINSVGPGTCCLLLDSSDAIQGRLKEKGCEVITFGNQPTNDISIPHVNSYLDAGIIMIAGQLFVHHLSCNLGIDTDEKNW